jgi:hypothetical protein
MEIYINKSMIERAARVRKQQELSELAREARLSETCAAAALWVLAVVLASTMIYTFVTR